MPETGGTDRKLLGERVPAPRGALTTVLVILSGAALVVGAARLFARTALGYRRPATVTLDARGLVIFDETRLLGRTLSERETLVPASNLSRVERETRYSRLGLYAGLVALAVGTYVGTGLVTDGLRVQGGSPSLLGLGAVFVVLGVLLDYGLTLLGNRARGTCRLVVERRSGGPLCVSGLEPAALDAMLSELRQALEPLGSASAGPLTAPSAANPV